MHNASESIPPAFMAGEKIATSSFMFVHEMNLSEVRATFLHEDGGHEIVLVGVPRVEDAPQQVMASHWPRLVRFSRVRLEGVVDREDPVGEYGCTGVAALSAGGNEVAFEDVPNLRFRVFAEPTRRPHIAGAISLGPQQDMFDVGRYDPEKDEFVRPKYDRATGQSVDAE